MAQTPWGSDAPVSLPQALDSTDVQMADMEGFCFTPDGLRVNISVAEREDIIAQSHRPTGDSGG